MGSVDELLAVPEAESVSVPRTEYPQPRSSATALARRVDAVGSCGELWPSPMRSVCSVRSCSPSGLRRQSSRARRGSHPPVEEIVLFALTLPLWVVLLEALRPVRPRRGAHRPLDGRRLRRRLQHAHGRHVGLLRGDLVPGLRRSPASRSSLSSGCSAVVLVVSVARHRPHALPPQPLRTSRTRSSSGRDRSARAWRASCCSIRSTASTSSASSTTQPRERRERPRRPHGARRARTTSDDSSARSTSSG